MAHEQRSPIVRVLRDHYRAGYSRTLLWFDSFFLILAAVDFFSFYARGFGSSLWKVLEVPAGEPQDFILNALLFALLLTVILPLLLAFFRIQEWLGAFRTGLARESSARILVAHSAMCALLIYLILVTYNMQVMSGLAYEDERFSYAFRSIYYSILVNSEVLSSVGKYAVALIGASFAGLIGYIVHGKELAEPVKHYLARAALIDFPSELQPVRTNGRSIRMRLSTEFEVGIVRDVSDRFLKGYQQRSPGSPTALRYLDDEFQRCKDAILDLLIEPHSNGGSAQESKPSVAFFTDTYRAFEVALAQASESKLAVVSPFASPSLLAWIRWISILSGRDSINIEFEYEDYLRPWQEQQGMIVRKIQEVGAQGHRGILFIVSEVFYATGRRIPLAGLLKEVRTSVQTPVKVIVDGTDAIGNNCLIAADGAWDHYVFSFHHWLAASAPRGILLSRQNLNPPAFAAPESWQPGRYKTDAQIRASAELAGAIELIKRHNIKELYARSKNLSDELRLFLPEKVQLVAEKTGLAQTFILSFSPEEGHTFRFLEPGEIEAKIAEKGVKASVVRLDALRPWVCTALPFHTDPAEIGRLCRFLELITK